MLALHSFSDDFEDSKKFVPLRNIFKRISEGFVMANITVSLPDDLAQQAQSAGLLRPEALEILLRKGMKKSQIDQLFSTMDKLGALQPQLTEEEIDAEIAVARAERAHRR